jgi:hypothetical protein
LTLINLISNLWIWTLSHLVKTFRTQQPLTFKNERGERLNVIEFLNTTLRFYSKSIWFIKKIKRQASVIQNLNHTQIPTAWIWRIKLGINKWWTVAPISPIYLATQSMRYSTKELRESLMILLRISQRSSKILRDCPLELWSLKTIIKMLKINTMSF